ncbi:MAG: hypothetical protein R2823_09395 [Acidimicrobiia bacterium]
MKRLGLVGLVTALLAVAMAPALAAGVSALPGVINIDNALRGSTVFRTVTFYNDTGVAAPFELDFEGEAGAWMTAVDPEDRATEISEVLDEDGTGAAVGIRIDIPESTENRAYQGVLRARLAPPDTEDGLSVGLGLKIPFTIDVTGDQIIAATLHGVSLRDTEVGVPARVHAVIENEGNTQVIPEFTLVISKDGSPISTTTTASVPSLPGEEATFEIRWDTSNAEPGAYTASLSTNFSGIDLGTEELEFTVHPAGSLDQVLAFVSLEPSGEAHAGGLAGFAATIQNPGQVDVLGTVVGELTQDGVTVSTYESQQFLVQPDAALPLPINIEIPQEGDYEFTALVRYGDTETDSLTVAFTAVAAPGVADDSSGSPLGMIAFGIAVLALLGLGGWFAIRKRNGNGATAATDPDKESVTVGPRE